MLADIYLITLRSILSLITIFILTKMIGARQISQMTYYDYIIGISIGSIAAELALDKDLPVLGPTVSMIVYALITILLAYLSNKNISIRKAVTGTPSVIIYKGKIIEANLRKNRLDINDLLTQARINGYFSINDIEFAIFETTGAISFMPKENKRPTVLEDLTLSTTQESITSNVIMDGNIMEKNLKTLNKSSRWLKEELIKKGYKNINNILLATLDGNDNLYVFLKNQKLNSEDYFM